MTDNDEKRIEDLISRHLDEQNVLWSRMDEMDWLHYNRMKAEKRLKASQERLTQTFNHLRNKEVPTSLWERGIYWAERGMNIAKGVKIGYQIGGAISIILAIRRRLKKK